MGPGECWQYIVRKRKAEEEALGIVPLREGQLWIGRIPRSEADIFIRDYEWLGNSGASKYCFGLRFGRHLAAVACYTTPPAPRAFETLLGFGSSSRVFQLCRGASTHWAPPWAASKIISRSLQLMAREFGAAFVVAYADPEAGEIGTVYQAANAVYLGLTDSRGPGKYIICGRTYHARTVPKHFGTARHDHLIKVDPDYKRIQRTKKHRYVFVVGSRSSRRVLLARLSSLIRPYPKRVGEKARDVA
jgi:hypothetical protein